MDMPDNIYAKAYLHQDDNETVMVDAELQPYEGYELFIRADAGNVLPELEYPWFYYETGQSPLHMLWYCQIANFDTKETHFAEECDNLRAAAEDAIKKIKGK